jgi:hypothetical protein
MAVSISGFRASVWILILRNIGQKSYYSLGAFAKLQNGIISFVMCVCPLGAAQFPLEEFSLKLIFEIF